MIESMRAQVEFLQENLEREFSQADFRAHRLFPWAIDSRTWVKLIKADMFGENILKTRIEGEKYSTKYLIKGKNIIKYINKYGALMMGKIRESKWQQKNPRKRVR